jgi:hypothetical protein
MGDLLERIWTEDRSPAEVARLARLMDLLAGLPAPPDPFGLLPAWRELQSRFREALRDAGPEPLEEAFLRLYEHLHGREAPYSRAERARMDATCGYWNHAGGLSPILKAPDHLRPDSVSADFGAGNGLQGLLMQVLSPHARTVQIELSSRAVEQGRLLQAWLGIAPARVEWRVMDVCDASPVGLDFIYLYRPVRPEGPGRSFYSRFAEALADQPREVVIFSIADCLREFLSSRFQVFFTDGQLTCFRG